MLRIFTAGAALTLIVMITTATVASAAFEPILPLNDPLIGGEFSLDCGPVSPYATAAYDFAGDELYYRVGGRHFRNHLTYDLNFAYWLNRSLPGIKRQIGLEGTLSYTPAMEERAKLTVFYGKTGEKPYTNTESAVRTLYITAGYQKLLWFDWDKEFKLITEATSGWIPADGGVYYVSTCSLPCRVGEFRILPRIGYIKGTTFLNPCFDLAGTVRGYRSGVEQGNRRFTLTLEHRFPLFPYSDIPFLNLLNLAVFADAGEVLAAEETFSDFALHSSAGTGLVIALGLSEIRLEYVVTDTKDSEILFYTSCANQL